MASLIRHTRLGAIAVALALGLNVLPGLVAPLLSNEWASRLPGLTEVQADEPATGGG